MDKKTTDKVRIIARIGYSAKCLVYLVLGLLIIYTSFTAASTDSLSKKSVFEEILSSPFGFISLSAVTIGLGCYALWRLVQGFTNPSNLDMSKAKDIITRIFYFVSSILYAFGTYASLKVLLREPSSGESNKQNAMGYLLSETWGALIIGALGCLVIVFGCIQLKHALKGDFMDKFVSDMPSTLDKFVQFFGRLGFGGRTVLYSMIGGFICYAAITYDPDKAGGIGNVIATLLEQPFGPWLAACVGLGMMAFGVFCGFEGRYRKV